MEKQLSDLSIIELKSLAYDQMAQLELSQNNLRILNQELARRSQQSQLNASQTFATREPGSDSHSPVVGSIKPI